MILIDNFGEDKYCVFYNVTFIDICLRIKVGYAMSFDIPVLAFKRKELGFQHMDKFENWQLENDKLLLTVWYT